MLSGCSRGLSCSQDFHLYFNFEEFKNPVQEIFENPIQEIFENPQLILESIGVSAEKLCGRKLMGFPKDDDEANKERTETNESN